MGRPQADVDPEQVRLLAGVGCPMAEIGLHLGVSVDTLERRFADVINKGRADIKTSLRRKQVELALKGDKTMLIWLGKQLLGQSDETKVTHDVDTRIADLLAELAGTGQAGPTP